MTQNPRTVLLLIARFEFGGIPIQAFLWARFLKKHNFNPIILAQYKYDPKYLELLDQNDLKYGFLNDFNLGGSKRASISYFFKLIKCLNSYNPDFIFPFNKHLSYQVNLIWRFTIAKKTFFMERNHGLEERINWRDSFLKYIALFNSSGLIYNSYAASLNSRFPNKTFVIKNSFRKNIDNQNLVSIPFKDNDVVLLHIANIVSQKNYALLVKAWKLLKEFDQKFKLVVIGSDIKNQNQSLIKSFSDLGIHYLGSKSKISSYLKRANICLLSTHYEGCPNVILEYIEAGKLISASNIMAIKEVLDPINHKYLFDNQSPDDLVNKVLALYQLETSAKKKLIDKNKKKLLKDYSESNYNQVLNLINE